MNSQKYKEQCIVNFVAEMRTIFHPILLKWAIYNYSKNVSSKKAEG